MATEPAPDDRFESVDWQEIETARTGLSTNAKIRVAAFSAWALALLYDFLAVSDDDMTIEFLRWDATRVDWLFILTLLAMVVYVVIPLYQNRRMTLHYWKRFRRNKAAVVSSIYLLIIFTLGVFGPMLMAPPEVTTEVLLRQYQPPVFMGVENSVPLQCVGDVSNGMCRGTWQHPFGTTSNGQDILKLVIFGMRVSMQVALISTLMIILIATTVGTTSAYFGGYIDEALMRYVDVQLSFPEFPLYLLLVFLFEGSLFLIIMIFGLFSWGGVARLVRSEALQRTEEEYIKAANSAGAGSFYIIRRHVVPNVSNTVITAATLTIPGLILAEAGLSFIGLGDPSVHSWGQVIASGRSELLGAQGLRDTGWWISTVPGIFLFFTILAFNFLGDALRDALDPRHEGGGGE